MTVNTRSIVVWLGNNNTDVFEKIQKAMFDLGIYWAGDNTKKQCVLRYIGNTKVLRISRKFKDIKMYTHTGIKTYEEFTNHYYTCNNIVIDISK